MEPSPDSLDMYWHARVKSFRQQRKRSNPVVSGSTLVISRWSDLDPRYLCT